MPTNSNLIKFGQGTYANYQNLDSKSQYEIFFCTDTHQIFLGANEYTKGTQTLAAIPTTLTAGDKDRLYAYNGSLYLCKGQQSGSYIWEKVANVNETDGTVTSLAAGEGLTTDQTDGVAITSSGTVSHAIPTGAATTADSLTNQTPSFGGTFDIKGIATDKFGHVTGANTHTVTLPTETAVNVAQTIGTAVTLQPGQSFAVVTGVGNSSAQGATNHDLAAETVTYTLPNVTAESYSVSSTAEGTVTLTGTEGTTSTATINGWSSLAKKSDITAVLRYKGTVATQDALPSSDVVVGDVYAVEADNSEYAAKSVDPSIEWEKLGPVIDLSGYATTAYVNSKFEWHEF